jgi:acetylglutamate kinase
MYSRSFRLKRTLLEISVNVFFSSKLLTVPSAICQGGVQRVHLLDGTISGVLLLELFKRDGMGTMVAR